MAILTNFQFDLYNLDGMSYLEFKCNGIDQVISFDNTSSACDLYRCIYFKYESCNADDDELGVVILDALREKLLFKKDPNTYITNAYVPKWRKPADAHRVYVFDNTNANVAQIEAAKVFGIPNNTIL